MRLRLEDVRHCQLRVRGDLDWVCRTVAGNNRWLVRDPLTLRFFYLSESERDWVLALNEGGCAPPTVWEAIQAGVNRSPLSANAVWSLIVGMWRAGLVRIDGVSSLDEGTGNNLGQTITSASKRWAMVPLRLLAIRVPLFDPTWSLERTEGVGRVLFSRTARNLLVVLWITVICMLGLRWNRLAPSIPDWSTIFGWESLCLLLLGYVILKSLHEASHAIACRRFGGECHDVGLLFLLLTPCLYCDVTDTWKIENRFARATIALAGVYVELWVAGLAMVVWMFTNPGLLNSIALSLGLIGSVGTVFVNANPLLRYDGYYALTDLINVPNLAQQANDAIGRPLLRFLTRGKHRPRPLDASLPFMTLFGWSAIAYRFIVLAMIVWAIHAFFETMRMGMVGRMVIAILLLAVAAQLLLGSSRSLRQLWSNPGFSRLRLLGLIATACFGAFWLLNHRWTYEVHSIGVVEGMNREPIFVARSGHLLQWVEPGQQVESETVVYQLGSFDDQRRIAELEGLIAEYDARLTAMEGASGRTANDASARKTLVELRNSRRHQLDSAMEDVRRLRYQSNRQGRFFRSAISPSAIAYSTVAWRGTNDSMPEEGLGTLREREIREEDWLGSYVERGMMLGWIADRDQWQVTAFVDEQEIERIVVGAVVRMRLACDPKHELTGRVKEVGREPVDELPRVLQSEPRFRELRVYRLVVEVSPSFAERPSDETGKLAGRWNYVDQMHVDLRIMAGEESLAESAARYFLRTIRW